MNDADTVAEARRVLSEWADRQGQDRCWWYPELFKELADILGIHVQAPALPSRARFLGGCFRFYQDEARLSKVPSLMDTMTVVPEVSEGYVAVVEVDRDKILRIMPNSDPGLARRVMDGVEGQIREVWKALEPGDVLVHSEAVRVVGVAKLSKDLRVRFVPRFSAEGEEVKDVQTEPQT